MRGLSKSFGDVRALDGVDLEVAQGTVMGLLGPNGAGKTTAVRVVATLLAPDAGAVRVAAADERRTGLERTSSWWAPVRDEARAPPTTGELPTRSHPVAAPPAGTKILSTLDDGGGSFPGSGDRDLLIEAAPADSAILRTHR